MTQRRIWLYHWRYFNLSRVFIVAEMKSKRPLIVVAADIL